MKIAFTSKGRDWDSQIDPRFGRTEYILVYDQLKDSIESYDNTETASMEHGVGPKTAQKFFDLKVNKVITGNGPGDNAANVLDISGIEVFTGAEGMTVKEAWLAFSNNKLKKM